MTIKLPYTYEISEASSAKITIMDRAPDDNWPNQKFRIGEAKFGSPSNRYHLIVTNRKELEQIEESIGTVWQSPFAGNSHESGEFYCLIELQYANDAKRNITIQFTDIEWELAGGRTPEAIIQILRQKFS